MLAVVLFVTNALATQFIIVRSYDNKKERKIIIRRHAYYFYPTRKEKKGEMGE